MLKDFLTKRLKRNISNILLYGLTAYVLLIPLICFSWKFLIANLGISLCLGFTWGFLNEIYTQLRISNGENFPHLDDPEKDKLLKS